MTIKELAKECNVHYNTMRKWLLDNEIKKANDARNSQFLLSEDVIKEAKNHFFKNNKKPDEQSDSIEYILRQQLTQKDIQIVKQQEQINNLQKLLENQQILTLKTHEKAELLEMENYTDQSKMFKKTIFGLYRKNNNSK